MAGRGRRQRVAIDLNAGIGRGQPSPEAPSLIEEEVRRHFLINVHAYHQKRGLGFPLILAHYHDTPPI